MAHKMAMESCAANGLLDPDRKCNVELLIGDASSVVLFMLFSNNSIEEIASKFGVGRRSVVDVLTDVLTKQSGGQPQEGET